MNYSFHAGAEQDVTDALDFYGQQAGLQVAEMLGYSEDKLKLRS